MTEPQVYTFPFEERFFSNESINAKERIIFHYTGAAGAFGILKSKALRLTSIEFMNDSAELKYASGSLVPWVAHQLLKDAGSERRALFDAQWRAYRERSSLPNMYVACFTEASDLLSQWRGYASPSGYALGFSLDALKEMADRQNLLVGPVVYTHSEAQQLLEKPVSALLRVLKEGLDPGNEDDFQRIYGTFSRHFKTIFETCMLIKHPGFAEEREWRVYSRAWTDYRPLKTVIERRGELAPVLQMDLHRGVSDDERKHHDICFRTSKASPGPELERRANAMSELVSELNLRWSISSSSLTPLR